MAVSPERLKIMKLVQEGKISAEEAIELLDMLPGNSSQGAAQTDFQGSKSEPVEPPTQPKAHPQWFRVTVTDTVTGKVRVNVKLPVSLVNAGMKMGAKFSPQVEGVDSSHIADLIARGVTGKVMDIMDDDDGEHVEVFID